MCFPKEVNAADHLNVRRPIVHRHMEREAWPSQTPRPPMLLFEFDGALFQFDAREPEFADSFQFPPRITALPASTYRDSRSFLEPIHEPSIFPTSAIITSEVWCCRIVMILRSGCEQNRSQ